MKFLIEPWEHQKKALALAIKALLVEKLEGFALFMEMGCLARDSVVSINVNGKAQKITIEEFYRLYNRVELAENQRGFEGDVKIRSLKEGVVGLNDVLAVYRSGEKEVFKLKTKGMKPLKLTAEHRVMTNRGWVEAQHLEEGDMVACDLLIKHQRKKKKSVVKKPRYNLIQVGEHHPFGQKTLDKRYGKTRVVYRIEKHRAIYEQEWNGISDLKTYQEISKDAQNAKQIKYFDPSIWHIHHIDHNHKNNSFQNLTSMRAKEHLAHHSRGYAAFGHGNISWRSFESLEHVGKEMTYDIAAKAPYNSFIANNMVVHNTGKTATAINICRALFGQNKRVMRTLVFCPPVVRLNWKREFKMHSKIPQDKIHILEGSGAKRTKLFLDKAFDDAFGPIKALVKDSIFITNYESLSMKELYKLIQEWEPELIIFDESHKLKSYKAKRTKLATVLADRAKYKLLLTGTPILNNAMDIWSQFRILDRGATFDKNFFAFRARYFVDRNAGMPSAKYFPDWRPVKGMEQMFNRLIYTKAFRVMKSECLDLPPIVRKRIEVQMGTDQARMYNDMLKSYVAYLNDKACVASIALTKALRLQQIASGHFVDDEGGVNTFKTNPRLAALSELLEQIAPHQKVIVWSAFKQNYKEIQSVCDKLDLKSTTLTGGMTDKQRNASIDSFQEDPTVRVLCANQDAGGTGVNLTSASCMIYFSKGFKLEADLQSECRAHRGGSEQHKSVTRIDLVSPGTIDETITEALARKENLAQNILRLKDLL